MIYPLWPEWLDDIWAKSPEKDEVPGESLATHTWQVLQRFADLISLRPDLPEKAGIPGLWNCLFWACWLHDFGKAAVGFQDSLRGGPRWPHRHEVLSLAFIDWFEDSFNWEETLWLAAAVAFHHKDINKISLLYMDAGENTLAALTTEITEGTLHGLWRWLAECSDNWRESLGLASSSICLPEIVPCDQAVSGFRERGAANIDRLLRGLRRWKRDKERRWEHDYPQSAMLVRGHMITSDHTASAHAGKLPPSPLHTPEHLLANWRLRKQDLYQHQRDCLGLKGSAVLVAPTGSGKTEAALLWACSQGTREAPVPRLFYTLPYQASMNAMYDRLNTKSFPEQVGLEHSRSTLALYRLLLDDDYDHRQAMQLARWAKSLCRLHYYPVRVLSPYQMLKFPYQLKGYESLLTDLVDAAFIFDEVHAYEVERLAAILGTVSYLRENFGARVLIMSATLPGIVTERLFEAIGTGRQITAAPEVFREFRRHRLLVEKGEITQKFWLERIVKEAKAGYSVLVCCNTIKRAQSVYEELNLLLDDESEVILLHGRFNGYDRLLKERLVQTSCGSGSAGRRPVVLIATQVVEVSLDIDLDVIYTDPAPLEALIQRFGRINRRRLKAEAPVHVLSEPADGQKVYNSNLVARSLEILREHSNQIIAEEEVTGWLDEIYCGEIADLWRRQYQEAYQKFQNSCLTRIAAFEANENLEEIFYQAFDGVEVLPASLEDRHRELLEAGEPLEAMQLLVPLSWGQFCRLRNKNLVKESATGRLKVVEVPYNSEYGLQL